MASRLAGQEGTTDPLLSRLLLSAFLSVGVMVFSISLYGGPWGAAVGAEVEGPVAGAFRGVARLAALALSIPIVALLGVPLVDAVWRLRRFASVEALVVVGVGAAFALSIWNILFDGEHVYLDTVAFVLVFVSLGRWIESCAKERTSRDLRHVLGQRPRAAERLRCVDGDEQAEMVDALQLEPGDRIRLRPGDLVPADGVVEQGSAQLNTSALTGEEAPRSARPGDTVLAGQVILDAPLVLTVKAVGSARVLEQAQKLMQEVLASRPQALRSADLFAGILLPLAFLLAGASVALRWGTVGAETALLDGLAVLLIACPCALSIATPLALWSALGTALRQGVLVRGAEVLEALAGAKRVLFDKTGTLTDGTFDLLDCELLQEGWDRRRALSLAAALEEGSEHPIGRALVRAAELDSSARSAERPQVQEVRILPGRGVEGTWRGGCVQIVSAGGDDEHTEVLLRVRSTPVARFRLGGRLRPEAPLVVRDLRDQGLDVEVLTGDGPGPGQVLAEKLDVVVHTRLLPHQKVERVASLGPGTVFCGDGLNDGAALATAEVGVAVSNSVDRSFELAAVNLLHEGIEPLPGLVRFARRARRVARGNLLWACSYNVVGLGLAATGYLTPVFAAAAMAASSLVIVLRSQRMSRWSEGSRTSGPPDPAHWVGRPLRQPAFGKTEGGA